MSDEETQEDRDERKWEEGNRAAWRSLLSMAMRHLEPQDRDKAQLVAELEDVRTHLRRLCEEYGDNDWDDDLHLGDVIDKHLAPYLDDLAAQSEGEAP